MGILQTVLDTALPPPNTALPNEVHDNANDPHIEMDPRKTAPSTHDLRFKIFSELRKDRSKLHWSAKLGCPTTIKAAKLLSWK